MRNSKKILRRLYSYYTFVIDEGYKVTTTFDEMLIIKQMINKYPGRKNLLKAITKRIQCLENKKDNKHLLIFLKEFKRLNGRHVYRVIGDPGILEEYRLFRIKFINGMTNHKSGEVSNE